MSQPAEDSDSDGVDPASSLRKLIELNKLMEIKLAKKQIRHKISTAAETRKDEESDSDSFEFNEPVPRQPSKVEKPHESLPL